MVKPIQAIAVFTDSKIKGFVTFTEQKNDNKIRIDLNIIGLKPNSAHGFHVHEAGDLTDKCTSMCSHFNPYDNIHGCPGMKNRHVGDLGNIHTNPKGDAESLKTGNAGKRIACAVIGYSKANF
jgi:Cu-Zn family superoxide dismutase